MLKALELIGFKSFADKTRFEFPPGITVIVGPNGSGKSNVVDAMKWVLGEQSAKSLRGKDMSDVIFKGSNEGGRRMLNAAEATIIFDNSENKFQVDTPEVHVTRRVYRSGEGEYLINGQACRLKDIKDLLRGTGVGTDAYSLIEQGKVDRMLQASAKDRRAMFEEAAGISRFKAKKVEAERRLLRVEQNLVRLSDIVDEVESRLRSVRAQASKARRFREYTQRLQELRTQVGLVDWWRLSRKLSEVEEQRDQLRETCAALVVEIEQRDQRLVEIEEEANAALTSMRRDEAVAARNREAIVSREAAVEQAYARDHDLEELAARYRRQVAAMTGRAGDLRARLARATRELREAEDNFSAVQKRLESHELATTKLESQLAEQRQTTEANRAQHVDAMKAAATLGNRLSGLESQAAGHDATESRCRERLAEVTRSAEACAAELETVTAAERSLTTEVAEKVKAVESAQKTLDETRESLSVKRDGLAELKQERGSVAERAAVLAELEKNKEGVGLGVREILQLASDALDGPFVEVDGMVADLLEVGVDVAPLVDVALGDRAQHLVLFGGGLIEELQSGQYRPAGRVGFVRADVPAPRREDDSRIENQPGVIGRADRLVNVPVRFEHVAQSLLGDTWFVETIHVAVAQKATAPAHCRFITEAGELVDSDGSIIVGPRLPTTGLVSRRNELWESKRNVERLDEEIATRTAEVAQLRQTATQHARALDALHAEQESANKRLGEQQSLKRTLSERRDQLQQQEQSLTVERDAAAAEQTRLKASVAEVSQQLKQRERGVAEVETALLQSESRLEQLEQQRDNHARDATTAKIDLAKSEQQLEDLQARMVQFEEDQRERRRTIEESESQLHQSVARLAETQREILTASSMLATLYLEKDQLGERVRRQSRDSANFAAARAEVNSGLHAARQKLQAEEERQHKLELSANEARHQRDTMAERIREDYGIDLAEAAEQPTEAEQEEREAIEKEITELRRKLSNIGAVNEAALVELEEIEARYDELSSQYRDLVEAKEALERIIHRINADSRRLFEDTLEIIRANFQTLYRQSFGGGRADLVLEEGVDVLEAGVDIVATPPGKPSFNNSLLSGGEKALTAVALLLAIFQYRPSPFCVLDEVDAPFDEANVGRFVDVLHGFLSWTRFVIVTHSKKTMTAATTLYGVTMQESGVSKQVSVRFEDVSEDGHISQEAIDRSDGDDDRGAA